MHASGNWWPSAGAWKPRGGDAMERPTATHIDDKTLTCTECRASVVWSIDEQRFYAERAFAAPKRCRPCRTVKRRRFATDADN